MGMHDALIDALAMRAAPVKRVAPSWLRAILLAALMLALGFVATRFFKTAIWSVPREALGIAGAALSLAIGMAGLSQALSVSIAGQGMKGKSAMLLAIAAWLAVAAIGMSTPPTSLVRTPHPFCFAFLLVAGLPMIAVVLFELRRTRSIRPLPSLLLAGGSVAFLSFGLLALCHPVELSIVDFVMHLMAALILGLLTIAGGRRMIAA